MPKRAFVTGATGQDGSYLMELLLKKRYDVYGLVRRLSVPNIGNIKQIKDRITLLDGDLMDQSSLNAAVKTSEPDEVYNLAAQSFVGTSFVQPVLTGEITGLGAIRVLEAVRAYAPSARVYQASCYDEQTRVLTTEGLKTHDEVKIGDIVLTVNIETNQLELKPVKRVIVNRYSGEMVKISGRRLDLLVTPNHRLLLQGTRGLFYSVAGTLDMPVEERFFPSNSSIKSPNPEWRGLQTNTLRLSEIAPCDIPCNATKNLLEEIQTNDLFWLTGLYVGDGYTSPDKRSVRSGSKDAFIALRDSKGHFVSQKTRERVTYPSHNLYFAIPLRDKSRRRLISWLEKYQIDYRVSPDWVRFSSYTLAHFLRTCGPSVRKKHIPEWMLAYDQPHLRALFDGLIGSDGHAKPNGKSYSYVTTSRQLVPQIVELAIKLGLRCSTSAAVGKDVAFIREARVIHSGDNYRIHISDNHGRRPLTLYPTNVSRIPYDGIVWCLEIADNHNFVVERNGRYAFCGNSSEMFGRVEQEPQDESTPMHPRSPYGVAKVYAYWACVNYREAHDLFVSNGILFNHECVTAQTPVIVRYSSGMLDCLPISETIPNPSHVRERALDFEVWDRGGFTRAKFSTATWNSVSNDKRVHRVLARYGEVHATAEHQFILEPGKGREAAALVPGDRLRTTTLPDAPGRTKLTSYWAELLGLLVAEGSVSFSEGHYDASFRNNDQRLLDRVQELWEACTAGSVSESPGRSGFTGEPTGGLRLSCENGMLQYLHEILYTETRHKRVPRIVLNADEGVWQAFLSGYNDGDGLKAGRGNREFKNFKTSSTTLAAGLWWMASRILDQKLTLNVDFVFRGKSGERKHAYYSINLGTEGGPTKGRHLLKPESEVKRVISEPYSGWLYDIETASGTFHAGVGSLVIHNSPRRGMEFVTRKIAAGVAQIANGKADTIPLGNLDAKRDWGHAPEFVELMWRILQYKEPTEFVGATGHAHSVREFAEEAFRVAGVSNWEKHIVTDEKFIRPSEVYNLRGDASKAKKLLGWSSRTDFRTLVKILVEAELERVA